MLKQFRIFLLLSLLLCFPSMVHGQEQRDSIRFSLMTCAPGQEIYSLFGHTAIRYENYTRGVDVVFNYGLFSFNTPNFVMRFVKGETDYQLGVIPYEYFEAEYAMRGSDVYQQVLNLTERENQKLLYLLEENYKPQNRVYRYNYFYDNCTSRARDRIEQAIDGNVVYPDSFPDRTFRSIVHEYTRNSDWDELGIDLCLGAAADRTIGKRLQMFAPFYMRSYAQRAFIVDSKGVKRPLVSTEFKAIEAEEASSEPGFVLSPMICSLLFFAICLFLVYWQYIHGSVYWWLDIILCVAQGVAGCIIAFLFFFSVHPTVGSNWMIILFNPLPLLCLPWIVFAGMKHKHTSMYWFFVVYLTLFICIIPVCGQKINLSVLPLALGLLVNYAGHILVCRKRK